MGYFYLFFPLVVWLISQTTKFFIRLARHDIPSQLKGVFWLFVWAGGVPSTHTAILSSSLYVVWYNLGFSPILTFCTAVTVIWLYDLVTARKRQELLNGYFAEDGSPALKKLVKDGYLLDMAGHTTQEILWGALLGISLGIIATMIFK